MKNAIIIGASSGIGMELARLLAQDGYQVAVTGRRISLLNELQREYPDSILPVEMNVQQIKESLASLDIMQEKMGRLDLFVISAGIGDLNPELEFSLEKEMIDTNVMAFTALAGWAFLHFQKQGSGMLVAISSVAGLRGNRQSPAYSATKSYQIKYLEGLRQKAYRLGKSIQVLDVRPGFVDTKMAKGEGMFWIAPVQKASRQIYEAIRQKKSVVYITRRWKLVAGLLKILPGFLHKRL